MCIGASFARSGKFVRMPMKGLKGGKVRFTPGQWRIDGKSYKDNLTDH